MKYALALVAAATLAACGGGGGSVSGAAPYPTPTPVAAEPARPVSTCSVAVWGDSIAGGVYPLMDKRLDVHWYGMPGTTAAVGLPQFLQSPLAETYIVIEYGTNDANFKSFSYEYDMRTMLDRVKAMKKVPVLTGLSRTTYGDGQLHNAYNALASQLAKEYGAMWIDWGAVPGELQADGIHPDPTLYKALADKLSNSIAEVCYGKQQ